MLLVTLLVWHPETDDVRAVDCCAPSARPDGISGLVTDWLPGDDVFCNVTLVTDWVTTGGTVVAVLPSETINILV